MSAVYTETMGFRRVKRFDLCRYDPTQSGTLASLGQELLYTYASPSPPTGSSLMNISGEVVSETMLGLRSGEDTTNIILVNSFRDAVGDAIEDEYGRNQGFAGESSGYLGLGIDRVSIISQASSFLLGEPLLMLRTSEHPFIFCSSSATRRQWKSDYWLGYQTHDF